MSQGSWALLNVALAVLLIAGIALAVWKGR